MDKDRIFIDWDELKTKKGQMGYISNSNNYTIFVVDGVIIYWTTFCKNTPVEASSDQEDFENNYKTNIDNGNGMAPSDSDGRPYVYASPRPMSCTTIFVGAGDDIASAIVAGDEQLLFDMSTNDISKQIDMKFIDDVYIKDGLICFENAPWGASLDAQIIHPVYGVVAQFATKCLIYGTSYHGIPFNTEDCGKLDQGSILRVIINNGNTPTNFKAWGRFEMYRENTI